LNTGVVPSAISISAPVCGFLPLRAALLRVSNVPKRTSVTLSLSLSDIVMLSNVAVKMLSASFFVIPDLSDTNYDVFDSYHFLSYL